MQAKPNVIVFFTDQQRFDTTGVHGNPLELTPNFDRMAQAGTHLYHTFTPQPVCGPARACLQTGQYGTKHGCYRNGIPLPAGTPTLAHHFKNAGYQTGYIGKWHLADSDSYEGAVPETDRGGYDYWLAANLLEFTSDAYATTLFDNDNQPIQLPGYRVDALTDAAIRYIDRHQAEPFFLFISYIEPHHQNHVDDYPPPDGYRERYTGRWTPADLAALGGSTGQHLGGYFGMVKRLDEALGRLRDALKSLALADDTILLFTSDHGCHFKTRNDEYKRSIHESSIRVPAAIYGPGFTGGGQRRELVSLLDLPPTLLNACNIPIPETYQGRSLLPILERQTAEWPTDIFIQVSESQVGRGLRTGRWKYGIDAPDKDGWAEPGAETYVEQYLYDLQSDPHELTNLIGLDSHRALCDSLQVRLRARMAAAGEHPPEIRPAPSRPGGQRQVLSAELVQ